MTAMTATAIRLHKVSKYQLRYTTAQSRKNMQMSLQGSQIAGPMRQDRNCPNPDQLLSSPSPEPTPNHDLNQTDDRPQIGVLVVYCGLLMALSGFTTDIMLPAFGAMVVELDTTLDLVQGTVASFTLFFGIGQFFYGPASGKFGRRPAIAVGLTIFIVGAILATLGNDIQTILAGRALQGLGAGSAAVLSRAILRDTHSGTALARAMALSMTIFAVGPIIAPLLGHAVVQTFGWRSTFACTGLLAVALLLFNQLRYRETNKYLDPDALKPASLWRSVKSITGNRQSSYFLACGCVAYCALFSYISNAPRIYAMAFDISGIEFAALFALTGFGIVLGQTFNRALLPRLGILVLLRISSTILFASSLAIAVLNGFGVLDAWLFTALMFCFNTSFLAIVSNTAALCLDPHPTIAGLASAFYGCITNSSAAIFITLSVTFAGANITNWSVTMVFLTLVCAVLIWSVRPARLTFGQA
jgi:DHA1 family bicyclomycin/chloramphenicol resistance-like MFS transporter